MRTLVLLCLLISSQHGFSKTIFVDPNSGKSHSSGTLSSPLKTLDEAVGLPPKQVIRMVVEAVESFAAGTPQSDDLTMMVIRYNP